MIWILIILLFPLMHAGLQGSAYLASGAALVSQAINWFFLGGHHDQTVSARAHVEYRLKGNGRWKFAYHALNFIFMLLFQQDDHCMDSHLEDVEFAAQIQRQSRE